MTNPDTLSPLAIQQQAAWGALCAHLDQWFHSPDLEALEICLTAAASHYWIQADPLWLFVIGPASSGKTSIIINACACLSASQIMGDLGKDTLLSAYGPKKDQGFLTRFPSPIMLFKDFTTILSKRAEEKSEIQAQLREVYDGQYVKDRGVGGVSWKGKATCIAVCTPALDRQWALQRDLGERFLNLRLRAGDPIEASLKAQHQRGHERHIAEEMRRLALAWVDPATLKPPSNKLTHDETLQLAYLAQFIAWSRSHVVRDKEAGGRVIIDVSPPEYSTRAFKALDLLLTFASSVRRSPETPMGWAKRIALDSIPPAKLHIMSGIAPGIEVSEGEIAQKAGLPPSSIAWQLEEMVAMKILTQQSNLPTYSYSSKFSEIAKRAGFAAFAG